MTELEIGHKRAMTDKLWKAILFALAGFIILAISGFGTGVLELVLASICLGLGAIFAGWALMIHLRDS